MEYPLSDTPSPRFSPHDPPYLVGGSMDRYALVSTAPMAYAVSPSGQNLYRTAAEGLATRSSVAFDGTCHNE